ncbi:MAG: NAD-dependent epimerase/dehydratase family protein [Promethearchaeota archaeon]
MEKENILLLGASGSMGHEAFKHLWNLRDKYNISLLLLPEKKEKNLFKRYEKKAGILPIRGEGVVKGKGLKIVWGNALHEEDIREACQDIDWCLSAMAFISPAADRNPKLAKAVNTTAIKNLVKEIERLPGGKERVKLIHTSTVAATGDRLPPIHVGRVGDPLKPSVYDYYACTKIAGERHVLESKIKHWAVLRMTFIMIPDLMSLQDPIMFHQPLNTYMENITSRDAGRGLVNCLEINDDSSFWRRVYNMGGGPSCRITYEELLKKNFELFNLDYKNIFERKWFALKNFHMQYYEDSDILNDYIHHWHDSIDSYFDLVKKQMPFKLKLSAKACKIGFIKKIAEKNLYEQMKKLAMHPDGTLGWIENNDEQRIMAFYQDLKTFNSIPDWNDDGLTFDKENDEKHWIRLEHGLDEGESPSSIADLKKIARLRGGDCISKEWNGDLYETVDWSCAFGHTFSAKPYTIHGAGHWCPYCDPPPWNYKNKALKNNFLAASLYSN